MSSSQIAPDSWEQQVDSSGPGETSPMDSADVTAKFSTLNVNAVEFVPSYGVKTAQNDNEQSSPSPTKSDKSDVSPGTGTADHSPILNGTSRGTQPPKPPPKRTPIAPDRPQRRQKTDKPIAKTSINTTNIFFTTFFHDTFHHEIHHPGDISHTNPTPRCSPTTRAHQNPHFSIRSL